MNKPKISKDLGIQVYDIEVFPNYFLAIFLCLKTGKRTEVEIFNDIGDIGVLHEIVENNILVGYNNKSYDDRIITYILTTHDVINANIYEISQMIISPDSFSNYTEVKKILWQLSKTPILSIDIMTMLFSRNLRVSLKSLQVTYKWYNVLECDLAWDEPVERKDLYDIVKYCVNDVEFTKFLFTEQDEGMKLRRALYREFKDFNIFSMDGVALASYLVGGVCAKNMGLPLPKFERIRTKAYPFKLNRIINPFIEFKMDQCKDMLKEIRNFTVIPKVKYFSKKIIIPNADGSPLQLTFGGGGIHAVIKNHIDGSDDYYEYRQTDAASYYPSQLCEWEYPHESLGDNFLKEYKRIRTERYKAKAEGDKLKDAVYKLSLNSLYGQYMNEHSPFHCPTLAMRITMNGQLMFLMLIEMCILNGIKVVSANTDSIDVKLRPDQFQLYEDIKQEWMRITQMELEDDIIDKIIFSDVNCYFAKIRGKDKIKEKGRWCTVPQIGKGYAFPGINIAIREYFMKNIPVETTIHGLESIYEFLWTQRIGRQFKFITSDETYTQKINRFYVSNSGKRVIKFKAEDDKMAKVIGGRKLQLANLITEKDVKRHDVHYGFYIQEAQNQIDLIKFNNNTLFT